MTGKSSRVRLVAHAYDSATEIELYDSRLKFLEHAVGHLETEVAPGMVKIRFKTGSTVSEVCRAVRSGEERVVVESKPLKFESAAPLATSSTTHEYHRAHAERASRQLSGPRVIRGEGGFLFVFARDFLPRDEETHKPLVAWRWRGEPVTGLTLHALDGALLVDFKRESEGSSGGGDRWNACMVELNPGSYRLRVTAGAWGVAEQIVAVCRNWQTQVFLLRHRFEEGGKVFQRADLSRASIMMTDLDAVYSNNAEFYKPDSRVARLTELARQGLGEGRDVISSAVVLAAAGDRSVGAQDASWDAVSEPVLREMLNAKFGNPMLGLLGAHLLRLRPTSDENLLRIVVQNLKRLVPDHPDVRILQHTILGEPLGPQTAPPMLRASWKMLLEASAQKGDANLIPPQSLASQVAPHIWGAGAWLSWRGDKPLPAQAPTAPAWVVANAPTAPAWVMASALVALPSAIGAGVVGSIGAAINDANREVQEVTQFFAGVRQASEKPETRGNREASVMGSQKTADWIPQLAKLLHQKKSVEGAIKEFAAQHRLTDNEAELCAYLVAKALTPAKEPTRLSSLLKQPTQRTVEILRSGLSRVAGDDEKSPLSLPSLVRAFALPPSILIETLLGLRAKLEDLA